MHVHTQIVLSFFGPKFSAHKKTFIKPTIVIGKKLILGTLFNTPQRQPLNPVNSNNRIPQYQDISAYILRSNLYSIIPNGSAPFFDSNSSVRCVYTSHTTYDN